jgi:hypothetical protein
MIQAEPYAVADAPNTTALLPKLIGPADVTRRRQDGSEIHVARERADMIERIP